MAVDPDLLVEVPIFQTLPVSERQRLAAMMREEMIPAGRVIFEVGDPGSAMYIVRAGKVRISIPGDSGEEMFLATLGPGEFFGELALLDQQPRSARATAIDELVLYSLGRDNFLAFVNSRPDAALAMLASTARRLRTTDELMRSRASFDVNEEFKRHETFGGRMADLLATHAGSWPFIGITFLLITGWIGIDTFLKWYLGDSHGIDQPGFVLLALILGIVAAVQAPIIMMSQNRDGLRDQIRADADFKVNLKNEVAIEKTVERLEEVRRQIPELRRQMKDQETLIKKQFEMVVRFARSGTASPKQQQQTEADGEEPLPESDGELVGEGTAVLMSSGAPPIDEPTPAPLSTRREKRSASAGPALPDDALPGETTMEGAHFAEALRAFRGTPKS